MKPRITLEETTLQDGTNLLLQEHDGRLYLLVHGQQICGPSTAAAEKELAFLAAAPFRPARQPKIWLIGLGLGQALDAITKELPQKRGSFTVIEPLPEIPAWHHRHIPDGAFKTDARVSLETDVGPSALARQSGTLHAILIHMDAAPLNPKNRPWPEDRSWLAAAYQALQPGGLLAIASSRPNAMIYKRLQQAGFDVAEHTVPVSPNAKKPRLQPIWLARKGRPVD
jgi:spermidine synthase